MRKSLRLLLLTTTALVVLAYTPNIIKAGPVSESRAPDLRNKLLFLEMEMSGFMTLRREMK